MTEGALPVQGVLLGGRYRLVDRLGAGGTAEIWRATDERLARSVAVKILSGPQARDPGQRLRIEREARAMAAIAHPNVVTVHDYGEEPGTGAPLPYLVLELVVGSDLAHLMASRGPLPVGEAADLLARVLDGLAQAHAIGIVHGDLKPANVLVGPDGPKVGDFGVARILGEETGTTVPMTTPAYAAPEVLRGERPTPASDVYSAACIGFEALSGRRPFDGDGILDLIRRHESADLPRLGSLRADVPARLAAAIDRGLAHDPSERFPDAHAFRDAIGLAAPPPTTTTSPPAAVNAPATVLVERPPTETVSPRTPRGLGRSRRLARGAGRRARAVPPGLAIAAAAVLLLSVMHAQATAFVRVPSITGGPVEQARETAIRTGFRLVERQVDKGGVAGTVVAQDPAPGTLRPKRGTVTVDVTRGVEQVPVPDVTGKTYDEASQALTGAGLVVGNEVAYIARTDVPAGRVVRTDPPAGQTVDKGTAVQVFVAATPVGDGSNGDDGEGRKKGRDRDGDD